MKFDVRDSRFHQVISEDEILEEIATGFGMTEGPIWHPYEMHLTFSDVPGNTMYRWSEREGMSTFRAPSHMANGNTYDPQGGIFTCEHATSRISYTDPEGQYHIVATRFEDKELNSPNDIVLKSDGSVYFTDPDYGRIMEFGGIIREQELPFQGVFRLDPKNSSLTLLADDFERPNGLCFSPNEKQLFVNDTDRKHIRVFDVLDDGVVTNNRVWTHVSGEGLGAPDGMKFNQAGHLFCTGPGGIHVFDSDANLLGIVLLPELWITNFTWGDKDLRSLYITAHPGSLYRLRMKAPGFKLF